MTDIKKIIKLDIITVSEYLTLKNFIIITGLGVFYSYLNGNIMPIFGVSQVFAVIFSTYPFLVGDESGIDSLYGIFGIKRESVVYGRYLWSNLTGIFYLIFGTALSLILSLIIPKIEFGREGLMVIPVWYILTNFIIAAQYPFYFRYGYAKAKLIYTTVILVLVVAGFIIGYFAETFINIFAGINSYIIIALALVLCVAFYLASIKLSAKWYREREFS